MSVLMRTITYATLFIGFVLVYLPARLLAWAGIVVSLRVLVQTRLKTP